MKLIKHWLLLSKVEYRIELSNCGELRPRPEDHIVFETLGIQNLTYIKSEFQLGAAPGNLYYLLEKQLSKNPCLDPMDKPKKRCRLRKERNVDLPRSLKDPV